MRFGPERARDKMEWQEKDLPAYLVHDLHEKLNSLCFHLFFKNLL